MKKCVLCKEIAAIKKNIDPYFVMELKTGYVVMSWHQYFKGYTIFVFKEHFSELHELNSDLKDRFLYEMSLVAEAVYCAFNPQKLNYAKLGNSDPHLHWHIIPRYSTDPKPKDTIWAISKRVRCSKKARPSPEELNDLKIKLRKELDKLLAESGKKLHENKRRPTKESVVE